MIQFSLQLTLHGSVLELLCLPITTYLQTQKYQHYVVNKYLLLSLRKITAIDFLLLSTPCLYVTNIRHYLPVSWYFMIHLNELVLDHRARETAIQSTKKWIENGTEQKKKWFHKIQIRVSSRFKSLVLFKNEVIKFITFSYLLKEIWDDFQLTLNENYWYRKYWFFFSNWPMHLKQFGQVSKNLKWYWNET